jgi:tetratricopeptide (TPR) repeat protein
MPDKLVEDLKQLATAELVRELNEPEAAYQFKHALIQDTAYASLLKKDRKQLHLAVGETLEQLYPDHLDANAALLAQHFEQAGDDAKALEYSIRAGDAAARVYANVEAISHYTRAVEMVAAAPSRHASDRLRHLYSSRGSLYELNNQPYAALENYQELETLAQARGDESLRLTAILSRATVLATPNPAHDADQAGVLLEQALKLARALKDRAAESRVLWNLLLLDLWNHADYVRAVQHGEASLALARELGLDEQIAFTLNDLSYCYTAMNQWGDAERVSAEAQGLWRKLGNLPMLTDSLSHTVLIHFNAGRFDQAVQAADEALSVSEATGNLWGQANSQEFVGNVYFERGLVDQAMAVMQQAIPLGDAVGHPAPMVSTRCDLARLYGMLGIPRRGIEIARAALSKADNASFRVAPLAVLAELYLLDHALASCQAALSEGKAILRPYGLRWYAPTFLALVGSELALAQQDYPQAIRIVDELLAHLQTTAEGPYVPDALYLQGRAFRAMGQTLDARAAWGHARRIAESLGSRRSLMPILLAYSELESESGDSAAADRARREARAVVEFIADHISAPDLKASFLARPDLRLVTVKP